MPWPAMWYDARKHVSPNAGWPEAAMAGALDIRLGGPRSYDGTPVDLPWLGNGRTDLDRYDIRRALQAILADDHPPGSSGSAGGGVFLLVGE